MSLAVCAWRRTSAQITCLQRNSAQSSTWRAFTTAATPFVERDIVILRQKSDPSSPPILTRPLSPGTKIGTHKGAISHGDIIGKRARDVVRSSSGAEYRIHNVSLSEYVRLTKRLVTPIYPADANLIVSLLDLHVSPTDPATLDASQPKLEILEAGTGHGALTLHLSRAIHAANPSKPPSLAFEPDACPEESSDTEPNASPDEPITAWKKTRRAVIHTIDVSSKYSKHASKVVQGFRHGLYSDNVDFHVGDVSKWVTAELLRRSAAATQTTTSTTAAEAESHNTISTTAEEAQGQTAASTTADEAQSYAEMPAVAEKIESQPRPNPFLTCAFLDLPSTHDHLATVASALHTDGVLIVFNPSVTQIAECIQKVKQENLPLFLEQTLELGTNGSSGGREWDVRAVKPRVSKKKDEPATETAEGMPLDDSTTVESGGEDVGRDSEQVSNGPAHGQRDWSLVCRPKVGERVVGGGFLGVFRKMKDEGDYTRKSLDQERSDQNAASPIK
ncbi:hypothetical protein MBLNU459_g4881t1 [Dothideomycetes sp. NU459]